MGNTKKEATKAFLGTMQGKTEYRGCDICYYTYYIDTQQKAKKYHVNVNVVLRVEKNEHTLTLALDKVFPTEDEAIKYGISQGEEFVDKAYKAGKMTISARNN